MNTIKCSQCNKTVSPAEKFCPHCGAPQNHTAPARKKCGKCNHLNPGTAGFCEKCGTSLSGEQTTTPPPQPDPNKIVSKGSYSGAMVKGKTNFWKRFKYAIIISVVVIAIALIIWFQIDPDAGQKLKTTLGGLLIVSIFLFIVIKSNKKGKRRRRGRGFRGGNRNDDHRDDDDNYDNDDYDDDDYDDDGGGDDD